MRQLIQWINRWSGGADGAGRLRVGSPVRLGPQHTAHVLTFGGRRWIVVCHPHGVAELSGGEAIEARSLAAGGHS